LELSGNALTGELDYESFAGLEYLTTVNISYNKLTGIVPDFLGTNPNLVTLNLAGNSFVGTVPTSTGRARKLRDLNLQSNMLSGLLP
jgi:Leucine-rich repeat (LRR) protein